MVDNVLEEIQQRKIFKCLCCTIFRLMYYLAFMLGARCMTFKVFDFRGHIFLAFSFVRH